ncbi:MAG: excinuclease ABC subunit UvrC [Ruminococcaceae bacterium]|nr:excinuclease ABC subunit UvrC [Oscillospiraceae bacterium]
MNDLSPNIGHLREKSAALPRQPGVYIMKNAAGKVIYVGKSRSLRDRVSQYFHGAHDPKTTRMAASVYDFRFITCDTEMEALALENSLIKQYTPKYNIKLKDAKSYPYIRIGSGEDGAEWPRITMSRKRTPDGSLYFGPYSSTATVFSVIGQLERTLKLPSCKRKFPADIGRERPCVYYQMGRCMGICTGEVSREEYDSALDQAAGILRGGTRDVIAGLTAKMLRASDALEFEQAARCRDAIAGLRKLGERQKAVGSPDVECDVIGLHLTDVDELKFRDCAAVFYIRSGYIADSEHFLFGGDEITSEEENENGDSPFSVFLMSLYQSREFIPGEILLSFEIPDHDRAVLSEYFTERSGHRVEVRTPKRGASKYLCDMAVQDAARHSENRAKQDRDGERTLASLAQLLKLEVLPERIEAYDISNLGDEHITCGMVVCAEGRMKKSEYRTFNIKSSSGQDDYASMTEAISRRLAHMGQDGDGMGAVPDLILLDGGRGHVSVVKEMMAREGYEIPVFGMVKDEHHKTRTLCDEDGEINIARQADVFRLIYGIQEEVHRYSVSRMTGAKRKTLKTSSLESIRGIGPAKAKALLKALGTIGAVREADRDTLAEVPGLSRSDADAVYLYYHKPEEKPST